MVQTYLTAAGTDPANQLLVSTLPNRDEALRTLFSGASAPSNPIAYMLWADTGNKIVFQRNGANSAWEPLWPLAGGHRQMIAFQIGGALAAGNLDLVVPSNFQVVGCVLLPDTTTVASVAASKEWTFLLSNVTQAENLFSATPSTATSVSGVTVEAGTELTANAKYRLTANQNQLVAPWDTLRLAVGSVGAPTAVSRISAWLYGYAVGA